MDKISIVTVCFNASKVLEQTIQSVINQKYQNIEYIVIDGNSTDGTVEIIKKYSDKIDYWVSEPDNGIYDAMNKGVNVATGTWVNFMNAGDVFFDENVIYSIFNSDIKEDCQIIYGKTIVKCPWGKYIVTPNSVNKLDRTMPFCHQSTFTRRILLEEFKFDTRLNIASDFNFFNLVYKKYKSCFLYLDYLISIFDACDGVSSVNKIDMLNDYELILKNKLYFKRYIYMIKKNIPCKIMNYIYRLIWYFKPRFKRIN